MGPSSRSLSGLTGHNIPIVMIRAAVGGDNDLCFALVGMILGATSSQVDAILKT